MKEKQLTNGRLFYIMIRLEKVDRLYGEVSEWSMVQHWKCCVRKRTAGSNPVLSAKQKSSTFALLLFLLGGEFKFARICYNSRL